MFRKEKEFQKDLRELFEKDEYGLKIVNQYIESPKRTKENKMLIYISSTCLFLFGTMIFITQNEGYALIFKMLTILSFIELCIYLTKREYMKDIVGFYEYNYLVKSLKKGRKIETCNEENDRYYHIDENKITYFGLKK